MTLGRRITVTPATTVFFFVTLGFSVAPAFIHMFILFIDGSWGRVVSDIIVTAELPQASYSYYDPQNGQPALQLCNNVPTFAGGPSDIDSCYVVFAKNGSIDAGGTASFPSVRWQRGFVGQPLDATLTPTRNSTGSVDSVVVSPASGGGDIFLDGQCIRTLVYANARLQDSQREDIVLIVFQVWLLGLSVFAILYESVPHIWACLFSRTIETGWSAYSLWRTTSYNGRFADLYRSADTPCHFNLFDEYLGVRVGFDIAEVAMKWASLLVLAILAIRLSSVYHHQTFRRLGPPSGVIMVYWIFMAVQVFLQLSVFFLVVALSLFLDQLLNGVIATLSDYTPLYLALCIGTIILLVPWFIAGWYAIRLEKKWWTVAFIVVAVVFIICWSIVFYSQVYRLTFLDWPFFACMTIMAFLVVILCGVFGVVCITNFGKGLKMFLYADGVLARAGVVPDIFTIERKPSMLNFAVTEEHGTESTPATHSPTSTIHTTTDDTHADARSMHTTESDNTLVDCEEGKLGCHAKYESV
ncbi:hypothetical protein OF83DRAFT_1172322 [Amylostereum chailletii]|nr:hypothetical protein OF83DRAFT_1172322 [Amylostereum chailletii]